MVNKEIIEKILDMSRVDVDENVKEKFINQFKDIINYVEKIKEVDTSSVIDEESVFSEKNIIEKDQIIEGFSQPDLRKYTKNYLDGYYTVPKILDKNN
ncbi:MAG TPA: Asp-tRNA(Asn)/Glu-tRNA(Gln) amidotransferase subunit GatC [Spirochaetota bacterium]|nr:Asp-tRNA(Asn)/Glu-tRNA(Gln) amidotransferase subunit GatC [Spirochaetota bacterium]